MPRRRKRLAKATLPVKKQGSANGPFDPGYNPGDSGYYAGRAEGKPAPRGTPKRTIPRAGGPVKLKPRPGAKTPLKPGKGRGKGPVPFEDRPGKRVAKGRTGDRSLLGPAPTSKAKRFQTDLGGRQLIGPALRSGGATALKPGGPKRGSSSTSSPKTGLASGGAKRIGQTTHRDRAAEGYGIDVPVSPVKKRGRKA